MFVRNKMPCPNCGLSRVFDVFFKVREQFWDHRELCITCINCDFSFTASIRWEHTLKILESVVYSTPIDGGFEFLRKEFRRLHLPYDTIKEQMVDEVLTVDRAIRSLCAPNRCYSWCLDHPILSKVVSYYLERLDRKRLTTGPLFSRMVGL